jgi:hypothetical protein
MTYQKAADRHVDACAEARELVEEYGSIHAASRASGIPRSTLKDRLKYDPGIISGKHDPGINSAMAAVGTGLVPKSAWLKTQPDADGRSYSVQLVPQGEDVIERIKTAFDDVKPAKPVTPPKQVMSDLCTLYPLMDAHIGMRAWGAETGDQDYDLDLARDDVAAALGKVLALTPSSDTAILLIGGDYFHADDNSAETPASKNKLDVDGRQFKVIDVGISILTGMIHALLGKHRRLIVRVMRGNHDEHSHMVLTFALAERYRDEPRVEIEKNPRDLFMMQWGRSAIFAHHGDKAKPQQMALYLSDVCPFWSATKHRHLFTGHVHHDAAKDVGPLRWESLRAFCPPDAYAASMGYGGRRAMQAVTFHNHDGLVLRAFDPVARP